MRAQFYTPPRPGGIGLSVVEEFLPNQQQVGALQEVYETIEEPDPVFVAEINRDGELIERVLEPERICWWVEEPVLLLGASRELLVLRKKRMSELGDPKE